MAFGNMLNKLSNAANIGADLIGKAGESISDLQAKAAQDKAEASASRELSKESETGSREELTETFTATPFEPVNLAAWEPFSGEERRFSLNGETLDIDAEMDAHNAYRRRFYDYARLATDADMEAYSANVHDLDSYLNFFPVAYEGNLDAVIGRAIDALISSGVFTVTADSFKERHMAKFHSFGDIQATIAEGIENASQSNRQIVEGVANLLMRSSSSGGILSDTIYGLRDTYKNNLIENATKINPEQARALFESVDPNALSRLIFADYWCVHLTLIQILIEEGKSIWWLSDDQAQRARNIFQNLTNPNFPQDQLTAMLIQILKSDPYHKEYHQCMIEHFGENEETLRIRDYFAINELDALASN